MIGIKQHSTLDLGLIFWFLLSFFGNVQQLHGSHENESPRHGSAEKLWIDSAQKMNDFTSPSDIN